MSDRWAEVRRLARHARSRVASPGASASGYELAQAAIGAQDIHLFRHRPEHPMLQGAKGVFDGDYIAYDRTMAIPQAAWVLAHELGHAVLHRTQCQCHDVDLDDAPVTARLPYGAAAVDTYNPRQRRELEANVFAAEFLLPPDEIRDRFLGGASFERIAVMYGVSPTATLNALASVLLQRPSIAQEREEPPREPLTLDPSQRAAAEVATGPVLVNAGPGTGKTRTLVGRIAHLVRQGVSPTHILALTYSNRAAGEMRERVARLISDSSQTLDISTFHGLCLELLRQHHEALRLPADFAIVDEIDLVVLLERHLAELPIDPDRHLRHPRGFLKRLVDAIGVAKDELVDPTRYAELADAATTATPDDDESKRLAQWAEVARVYPVYERLLRQHGFVDFGGLVMGAVSLLQRRPDILESLRGKYHHILVDEYQDMNRASATLLQLLAGDGGGLWVVGDIRQAIYRFRGAAPANIIRFPADFPGARVLDLEVNYRSDPTLVGLVRAVASSMTDGGLDPPRWRAARSPLPGPRVSVCVAADGDAEARAIAEAIRNRCPDNVGLHDQAVLVRTHKQARVIVQGLEQASIPAFYVGDLFARPEIRGLLALISLVVEGHGTGLMLVGDMHVWPHALSRDDRIRLIRHAQSRDARFPDALLLAPDAGLSCQEAVDAALGLHRVLGEIGWQLSPWQFLARYLFGDGSLVRGLHLDGSAAAIQQLLAIGQLLHVARSFAERPVLKHLRADQLLLGFLDHVRRLVAQDSRISHSLPDEQDIDAVRVLTAHAAKGLEFPVVYVPNLAAQRFPLQGRRTGIAPVPGMPGDRDDAESDESSLFFVAVSRAQQELVLSRAERYGKQRRKVSPFLQGLDAHFAIKEPLQVSWPAEERLPQPDGAPLSPASDRSLDVSELEIYLRCPRRYEYLRVLGLRDRTETLPYRRFQRCVTQAIAWLQAQLDAGTDPSEEAIATRFREEWDRSGEAHPLFAAVYAKAGATAIVRAKERLLAHGDGQSWRPELHVDVAGSRVRVPLDLATVDASGGVRVSRLRLGNPSDDDRKAHRVALIREGMRQTLGDKADMSLHLFYPTSDTHQELAYNPQIESRRLGALSDAVDGIRTGAFPASVGDACATCPFWMICPA